MRTITIAVLAAFLLRAQAVEYTPDPDVAFDIIQMHDTTTWEKVCESYDGVCDVPEGTYQVKLLDQNWKELVRLRDVSIQRSDSQDPVGADGTNSTDGSSAYAVAVANGFDGTEVEWLESLQGPAGSDGVDGMDAQLPTYSLGVTGPAGGFVFYVTDDGLHGYEAAPEDQGQAEWGCFRIEVKGARGTRLGSGRHNTDHIVAECESGTAADLADDYSYGGYIDWYLPSKDALILMHNNLYVFGQGGFAPGVSENYWSSSEISEHDAWVQYFNVGNQGSTDKPGEFSQLPRVRAIRVF